MKKLIVLLSLLSSCCVFASGTQEFDIVKVGVTRTGNYAFIDVTPAQTVSDCGNKNQIRWELNSDADKAILSLVITAQTAKKKIQMTLSDGDCLGDGPRPSTVYLLN